VYTGTQAVAGESVLDLNADAADAPD